jgi:hypothetical protein
MVSLYLDTAQTSLMHGEVELCDIIRASVLSLDEIPEAGHHVQLDTKSLLRRLADSLRRDDADWFEMDEDGSDESGDEVSDQSMDVD